MLITNVIFNIHKDLCPLEPLTNLITCWTRVSWFPLQSLRSWFPFDPLVSLGTNFPRGTLTCKHHKTQELCKPFK